MTATSGEKVRVDKWLWAVRVYRTRTAAADACSKGRVLVGDVPAKPATKVGVGDRVTARQRERIVIYEVVDVIGKRVSARLAAECYEDHSPPEPPRRSGGETDGGPSSGTRDRGEGRPTKRDRRALDRMRGRQ